MRHRSCSDRCGGGPACGSGRGGRVCIDCDVHRIEAAELYSEDYDATVARNVREQDADARPAITNPLQSLEGYHVVLLASPSGTSARPCS